MNIEEKKKLLSAERLDIKDEQGNEFKVGPEGSLGLLALGYKGIVLWNKARTKKEEGA